MRRLRLINYLTIIGMLFGFLASMVPISAASTVGKIVMVTPFQIYAAEDLTYLQKGIRDMLGSRLTSEGKLTVIQSEAPGGQGITGLIELAQQKGADYIITGSVTILGQRVSTDAQVLDTATQKKVVSFAQVGEDQAKIIDHIDQFAASFNSRIFGSSSSAATPSTLPIPASTPTPPQPEQPSIYQHPEKLLTDDTTGKTDKSYGPQMTSEETAQMAPLRQRSRKLAGQIVGVAAGDVDGDGQMEIITATHAGELTVQRIVEGRWVKVAEVDSVGHYVGVDVADVNGNGKAEIFVTSFDNGTSRVNSFVLEFNGKSLDRIAERLNWYFRSVNLPDRGMTLVGQRQGVADRFGKGIYEIVFAQDSYQAGDRLPLPRNLNVFGFGYGQVRESEGPEVVAYNQDGYVEILRKDGKEEWVTSDRFGGSDTHILFPGVEDGIDKDYVYLNPRLQLIDIDKDGVQEILVVRNEMSMTAMTRSRFFKKGSLVLLKWDETGMSYFLRTRSMAKHVSDFTIVDLDGDGHNEVVAAVVQKRAGGLGKGASYLAVFGMDAKKPES